MLASKRDRYSLGMTGVDLLGSNVYEMEKCWANLRQAIGACPEAEAHTEIQHTLRNHMKPISSGGSFSFVYGPSI